MSYFILLILFFAIMLIYFKIADRFSIIDKPNNRSSHSYITVRGGGIVFLVAAMISGIIYPEFWLPLLGLVAIGIISFIDDLITLSGKVRIFFHLIAVTFLFAYFKMFTILPVYGVISIYIIIIGIINAYNFMDGINGMTGLYSLVIFGGLQYINLYQFSFIEPGMIWLPMLSIIVFLFFNFRKKAKCFAGDVGSITIAFWIIMLLLQLILTTHNWVYIFFLVVYGIDSILTIIHRLILKQNIYAAHRLHFYQLLANEKKIPHLIVSSAYAFIQLSTIVCIIKYPHSFWFDFLVFCLPLASIYIIFKPRILNL